jgi:predicted deacylase
MTLKQSPLIVVPRANWYSIILNRRQINGDMNRKFADSASTSYEDQIVGVLKRLIAQSDCLLNLHDGSGSHQDQ